MIYHYTSSARICKTNYDPFSHRKTGFERPTLSIALSLRLFGKQKIFRLFPAAIFRADLPFPPFAILPNDYFPASRYSLSAKKVPLRNNYPRVKTRGISYAGEVLCCRSLLTRVLKSAICITPWTGYPNHLSVTVPRVYLLSTKSFVFQEFYVQHYSTFFVPRVYCGVSLYKKKRSAFYGISFSVESDFVIFISDRQNQPTKCSYSSL